MGDLRQQLRIITGAITKQNLVPLGVATPGSAVEFDVEDISTLGIQVAGSYTGALSGQATLDGTNWVTLSAATTFANMATKATAATIASAAVGLFEVDVTAFKKFRLTCLAVITGSAAITMIGDESNNQVLIQNSPTVDTEMPTVGTMSDSSTNPTTTHIAVLVEKFNNTTWDRERNNYGVSVESSSAKGSSGNSAAAITNFNARGAEFIFNVSAVSGTGPTLAIKLQVQDIVSGAWVDVPGAVTASITATGTYRLQVYPGITEVANSKVSYALPRAYRFAWTLGGTSPSFTFSIGAHYVN